MKIAGVDVIVTSPGRNFVTLKLTTSDGVVGLGDATLNGRELAVASYLRDHVVPLLIGRDADNIEDTWQYLYRGPYWRRGPVTMAAISAVDMALWDIKGKVAGLPVYQLLGGRSRRGALAYGHASGTTVEALFIAIRNLLDEGFKAVRIQTGVPGQLVAADAIDLGQAGHSGLDTDRLETLVQEIADCDEQRLDGGAGGVPVRERPAPAPAAEQLVHRESGDLALDVPQRHVHRRDCRHGHGPAPPVRSAVQVLPRVLDVIRVPAEQQRSDVIAQVGGDRELAPVEGRVPEPDDAIAGRELQGDEVATGTRDNHVDALDPHRASMDRGLRRTLNIPIALRNRMS